jgi:hypothetical protein
MNLRKDIMKYGRLVVFIRRDSAEIWGFRYVLTFFIGTLKIMASTGVFVRVVCALKHSIKKFPSAPSTITNTARKLGPHTQTDRFVALRAASFSARPFSFSSATSSSVISAARAAPRISCWRLWASARISFSLRRLSLLR